jgi:hypothetical protein
VAFLLFGCVSSLQKSTVRKRLGFYTVYKIDSINTYYIIYAKKDSFLYKIVSKRIQPGHAERILVNGKYQFNLHSITKEIKIGEKVYKLPLNVSCFSYSDSTKICLERDSINELSHAENIKGLYFMK